MAYKWHWPFSNSLHKPKLYMINMCQLVKPFNYYWQLCENHATDWIQVSLNLFLHCCSPRQRFLRDPCFFLWLVHHQCEVPSLSLITATTLSYEHTERQRQRLIQVNGDAWKSTTPPPSIPKCQPKHQNFKAAARSVHTLHVCLCSVHGEGGVGISGPRSLPPAIPTPPPDTYPYPASTDT